MDDVERLSLDVRVKEGPVDGLREYLQSCFMFVGEVDIEVSEAR